MPELNFNVSVGENGQLPVDKTLSIAGMAADAKAVGDALETKVDAGDIYDLEQSVNAAIGTVEETLARLTEENSAAITAAIAEAKFAIIASCYPVGSFYISNTDVDPSVQLGITSTWERVRNAFLWATDGENIPAGTMGGSMTAEHSHGGGETGTTALTVEQIPEHNHGRRVIKGWFRLTDSLKTKAKAPAALVDAGDYSGSYMTADDEEATEVTGVCVPGKFTGTTHYYTAGSKGSAMANNNAVFIDASHEHDLEGGGAGHSHTIPSATIGIMPPYLSVYIWRRIA